MAEPEGETPAKPEETREQRLARALRENLKRRKAAPAAPPNERGPDESR